MKQSFPVLTAGLWLALASLSAVAHTRLTASVPADNAELQAAPEQIELRFSEPVRLTAVSLQSGDERTLLQVETATPAETFAVPLPQLQAGSYTIDWRAVSADTHVISGQLAFSVAP